MTGQPTPALKNKSGDHEVFVQGASNWGSWALTSHQWQEAYPNKTIHWSKCKRHSSASFVKIWMGPSRGDILMFNHSWWINCGIFWLIDWEILHMTFILLMIHKSCKSSVLVRNSSWKNRKKTQQQFQPWSGSVAGFLNHHHGNLRVLLQRQPRLQEGLVRGWFRDNVYKPWKSRPHCGSGGVAVGYLKIPMTRPIEAAIPAPSISASRHSPASSYSAKRSRCYWRVI